MMENLNLPGVSVNLKPFNLATLITTIFEVLVAQHLFDEAPDI